MSKMKSPKEIIEEQREIIRTLITEKRQKKLDFNVKIDNEIDTLEEDLPEAERFVKTTSEKLGLIKQTRKYTAKLPGCRNLAESVIKSLVAHGNGKVRYNYEDAKNACVAAGLKIKVTNLYGIVKEYGNNFIKDSEGTFYCKSTDKIEKAERGEEQLELEAQPEKAKPGPKPKAKTKKCFAEDFPQFKGKTMDEKRMNLATKIGQGKDFSIDSLGELLTKKGIPTVERNINKIKGIYGKKRFKQISRTTFRLKKK